MAAVVLTLPTAFAKPLASLTLDMVAPEQSAHPQFTMPYAGFAVDPYAVVAGFPTEDVGLGTSSISRARCVAVGAGSGYPSPDAANVGSDWRFLAENQYVTTSQYWNPVQNQIGTFPYIHFVNQVAGVIDPVVHPTYTYLHQRTRVNRSAYAFKGAGYGGLHFDSNDALYPSVTLGYVLVPHAGRGQFWSLFDTGVYTSGAQFNVRYHKGAFEIYTGAPNSGLLFRYECRLVPGEPIIVLLTIDVPSGTAKFAAFDRKRTTKVFTLANLTGLKLNTLLGMSVQTNGSADYSKPPMFELLEFDIWMHSLSLLEIEQVITTLATVYAVGP